MQAIYPATASNEAHYTPNLRPTQNRQSGEENLENPVRYFECGEVYSYLD